MSIEKGSQTFVYILTCSIAIFVMYIFFSSSEISSDSKENTTAYNQIQHNDTILDNKNTLPASSLKANESNITEHKTETVLPALYNQKTEDNAHASIKKNLYESADSKDNPLDGMAYAELQSQIRRAIIQQLHLTGEETVNNTALVDIGLMSSDIIIAINNFSFSQLKETPAALESFIAGPETIIEIDRDGYYYKYTFILDSAEN